MADVVWKVYNTEDVDNGGARVQAPKGLGHIAVSGAGSANYELDDYSSNLPTTGTIYNKYDTRFTGCPTCTTN